MSLIKCPECNREISDTSKNCINCGYKLKKSSNLNINKNILALLGIIILIIVLFIVINNSTKKEELASCYDTDYYYKQIQDEIHDKYWQYDFIDIEYCDGSLLNGKLDAWCHFKYKNAKDKNYAESEISRTFNCSHNR